ncbi:MAG: hypothetical protein HZB20_05045 [Chloroflexi bacterium]|nr:hypothetical protein [Chloroflexota bacterium]
MSDQDKYVLAIDLGTSSAKVGLFSAGGEAFGWEVEPVPLYLLPNGGAEQDPGEWWGAITAASKRLLGKAPALRAAVIAICASTHGYGIVPVARAGNCLMRAMIWLDARGASPAKTTSGTCCSSNASARRFTATPSSFWTFSTM